MTGSIPAGGRSVAMATGNRKKDRQMKRKQAIAFLMAIVLGMSAGCAPGDIDKFTRKVQQSGEALFEETAPALAEVSETAADGTQEAEKAGQEESFETETELPSEPEVSTGTAGDSPTETGAAGIEPEGTSGGAMETAIEPDGFTADAVEETTAETEETISESESEQPTETMTNSAAAEDAGTTETASGSATADGTETEEATADGVMADGATAEETASLPERVLEAFAGKEADFTGQLAGRDKLTAVQEAALQAVRSAKEYDEDVLCLQNAVGLDGNGQGSYLLLFDRGNLTARKSVTGDLWFYNGKTARKLLENENFTQVRLVQDKAEKLLIVQARGSAGGSLKAGNQTDMAGSAAFAQAYRINGQTCEACFEDAVSIEETDSGISVTYASEHYRYDPVSREWEGAANGVCYYYEWTADGFAQLPVTELTVQEYESYLAAEEKTEENEENTAGDTAGGREETAEVGDMAKGGEETAEAGETAAQTMDDSDSKTDAALIRCFKIGDRYIGSQRRRIVLPDCASGDAADGAGPVAEYTYEIVELSAGRAMADSPVTEGKGYYFESWDEREEEWKAIDEIPNLFQNKKISRADTVLSKAESNALSAVLALQEYDADDLCFVKTADFDGDGKKEAFVAAGRYDGAFGAPVCELWYVTENGAELLLEKTPMKDLAKYDAGKYCLLLWEGYGEERLFGIQEKKAVQFLQGATQIEIEANGDVTAQLTDGGSVKPEYFHMADGELTAYGSEEKSPEDLLDYENGNAVLKHLNRMADGREEGISVLKRENGLWHVNITDETGAVSYETYRISGNELVLTDCGDGGYGG